MINFILDHIPIWGWVVIIGVPVGVLLFYFGPILLPIWNALPNWMKWTLGGIGAIFLAFMGGRYKGRANAEEEERKRNAEALQKRTEVDHDVANMSNKDVQDKLGRWTRD